MIVRVALSESGVRSLEAVSIRFRSGFVYLFFLFAD